jgi:hypothetical protein
MADPPAVSQGPPVVEQPLGQAVGRDLAVVEETLEKPGVKMSQMN